MKPLFAMLCIGFAFFVIGCATVAVNYDYDREANFNRYHTYKFIQLPKVPGRKLQIRNSLIHARVGRAIERELALKGYKKVEYGKPDLLIACHVDVKEKIDVTHYSYGHWLPSHKSVRTEVRRYKEGTLVLDIVDRQSKQLVWRGWATGLTRQTGLTQDEINETIHKILREYPPYEGSSYHSLIE